MARILIIRFSALGDVAMTIPIVYSFAKKYPMHEICFLSRRSFKPFYINAPENLRFLSADLSDKHKGLGGLTKLYEQLSAEGFDYVIDLHDVLRSKYLTFRFKLSGARTATIDKGRNEKKRLTRKSEKNLTALKSTFQRYSDTFGKAGFQFEPDFQSVYNQTQDISKLSILTGEKDELKWVGIAPFAKHQGKVYPEMLMTQVVEKLTRDGRFRVFAFGGGPDEQLAVNKWVKKYPRLISTISQLTIEQEIALISHLDVMISMDSGNMHLASLAGTPVVSVWGATHPYTGFMGWNQKMENAVQVDLDCRPCSVFGNKPCHRNDYACLYQIKPESIIERVEKICFAK